MVGIDLAKMVQWRYYVGRVYLEVSHQTEMNNKMSILPVIHLLFIEYFVTVIK